MRIINHNFINKFILSEIINLQQMNKVKVELDTKDLRNENFNEPHEKIKRKRQTEAEMLTSEAKAFVYRNKKPVVREIEVPKIKQHASHKIKDPTIPKEIIRSYATYHTKKRKDKMLIYLEDDDDEEDDDDDPEHENESFLDLQRLLDQQVYDFNRKHLLPTKYVRIHFKFEKRNSY